MRPRPLRSVLYQQLVRVDHDRCINREGFNLGAEVPGAYHLNHVLLVLAEHSQRAHVHSYAHRGHLRAVCRPIVRGLLFLLHPLRKVGLARHLGVAAQKAGFLVIFLGLFGARHKIGPEPLCLHLFFKILRALVGVDAS